MTRGAASLAPDFVRPTFEQLYLDARAWLPDALRRLGVKGDMEDLLHDVVIIAHRRIEHFDPRRAQHGEHPANVLRAWILGIARHRLAKRREAASREAALPRVIGANLPSDTHEAPSVEQAAVAGQRRLILAVVLAKIKPTRAEVLIRYTALEMSASEIARELGVNENTVKSRINRGRRDTLQAIQRLPPDQRDALASETGWNGTSSS